MQGGLAAPHRVLKVTKKGQVCFDELLEQPLCLSARYRPVEPGMGSRKVGQEFFEVGEHFLGDGVGTEAARGMAAHR